MASDCINCGERPDYMLMCLHHVCEKCLNTINAENDQRCPVCNEKNDGAYLNLPQDDNKEDFSEIISAIKMHNKLSINIEDNLHKEAEITAQKAVITESVETLKSDIEYVAPSNAQELLEHIRILSKYYSEYLSAIETHTNRLRCAIRRVEKNMKDGVFTIDQFTLDARGYQIKYDPYELLIKNPQLYKEDPSSNEYMIKDEQYIKEKTREKYNNNKK